MKLSIRKELSTSGRTIVYNIYTGDTFREGYYELCLAEQHFERIKLILKANSLPKVIVEEEIEYMGDIEDLIKD